MGKHEETQLKKLSSILDSLKDKASYCNSADLSIDIIKFTDVIINMSQKKLDRFQNEKLIKIEREYYATITRLYENCVLSSR